MNTIITPVLYLGVFFGGSGGAELAQGPPEAQTLVGRPGL